MQDWIISVVENFGYWGIFLLIMLENVFPPVPSEIILTFGGFMTTTADLTKFGVIAASTAGSVAGALILYGIGRYFHVERLEAFIEKHKRWLHLKKEDLHKADAWFDKYGVWTVFFCRLVPVVRSLISIPAGTTGMKLWEFLLFTTLGTLLWNTVLVWLGASVGENWEEIVGKVGIYSNGVSVLLAAGLVALLFWIGRKKKKASKN